MSVCTLDGFLPGEELLQQTELARITRRRLADGSSVICKEPLGGSALKRLRHELRILERLAGVEGVPRLVAGAPAGLIVMEDPCARPLRLGLPERGLEMPALVELAGRVAGIVAAIHSRGVAHKNLTPDTLLLSGEKPVLIDFGLATTFAEERPAFLHHREIAGTLAYLSPEQTGRTGRPVDQRADLYALGVTLYELATGELPFRHKDPLELIHDILALLPVPPGWRSPGVPQPLSDLIMRLLEKEPDRRYQSAQGVAHDLALLGQRLADGDETPFPLGERDFALRLSPPSRLVGRQGEIALLAEIFQRALEGKGSCLLVAGGAGVGKSALLNELRPLVTARGGFFVSGKFDQVRRDLASDAMFQAFHALGRLILAEPERELALLRDRLLTTLGQNAGLIAALHPAFALLLGMPPQPVGDDQLHCKERLVQAALDHMRAVACAQRPLVVVIDDLQWGAETPLGVFEALLAIPPIPGLLLVGAFRERELAPPQPLALLLARRERLAEPPPLLRLENLPPDQIALLLKEMLRLAPEPALRLARAVTPRTGGNPYDTVELVNALKQGGVLVAGESGWSWQEEAIRRHVGQGDVVELLEGRMGLLPRRAQELLEIMACLGGEVEPELLAAAGELSAEELDEGLFPCFEEGLLLPRDALGSVRFRHDRVQQAAYARVAAARRHGLHLRLARGLAAQPGLETLAAEQYLRASSALDDPAEMRRVVRLFRAAAARARAINFQEAERFLTAALGLLGRLSAEEELPLSVELHSERHAALYSMGRLEEADRLFALIERLAPTPLARAQAAELQVCSLTNRSRPAEAVELGVALLRELGVAVPAQAALSEASDRLLPAFRRWIDGSERTADRQRPELTEPLLLAAARVMNRIIPPAFFCDQALVGWWLVLESRRLWEEHAPCAALVGPLSHLGFVTIALCGDYRNGGEGVRHVLAVAEARGWEPEASQARFIYTLSVGPWCDPLQENVRQAQRAREGLLQGGDLQNACFTYYTVMQQLLDCAPTLEGYAAELDNGLAFATRTGNVHIERSLRSFRGLVHLLQGENPATGGWPEESAGEANPVALGILHNARALSAAIHGEERELARQTAALTRYLPAMTASHSYAQAQLLCALSLARQARECGERERPGLWARFGQARDFLAARAGEAGDNFLHLVDWLDAERAWGCREFPEALRLFDAALDRAAALQRPWQRALITERAALCHLSFGLGQSGALLLCAARECYRLWGASAKLRRLEAQHPSLRAPRSGEREPEAPRLVCSDAIDMLAVLRASQALSSETSLERLRGVVVELLGTMTGATAVSLLVRGEEGEWCLLPGGDQGGFQPLPVAKAAAAGLIPLSVFHYAERTREPLMVEDAACDDRFGHDRYLSGTTCCSMLAVPILNHGTPRALLMLENRLSRGAFTADLIDAVTLIAGQLAVSLENALLYQRLEERVAKRTRELSEAQSELVAAARHAGMAEIASNVLHNVGNVLNSVNVSADLVIGRLKGSRLSGLAKAVELIDRHRGELSEFLSRDQKGALIPGYLKRLAPALAAEQQEMLEELRRLEKSVEHIKEIVATQQCYAGAASMNEPVQVRELIEDALRMNLGALTRHEVTVARECGELPLLPLDKGRLLQILVNLISNGKQAMDGVRQGERLLTLKAEYAKERLRITVSDRGEGIPAENLSRIFNHGFTTRKGGHGFGLHSCALAAREMGGSLTAVSAGAGRGASFTLEIPVAAAGRRP